MSTVGYSLCCDVEFKLCGTIKEAFGSMVPTTRRTPTGIFYNVHTKVLLMHMEAITSYLLIYQITSCEIK